MKIRAAIFTENPANPTEIKQVADGICEMYIPEPTKPLKVMFPYVSINLGKFRVHLHKEDFLKFCKSVYNDRGNENESVALLR